MCCSFRITILILACLLNGAYLYAQSTQEFKSMLSNADLVRNSLEYRDMYVNDTASLGVFLHLVIDEIKQGKMRAYDEHGLISLAAFDSMINQRRIVLDVITEAKDELKKEVKSTEYATHHDIDRVRFESDIHLDTVKHSISSTLRKIWFIIPVFSMDGIYMGSTPLFYIRADGL